MELFSINYGIGNNGSSYNGALSGAKAIIQAGLPIGNFSALASEYNIPGGVGLDANAGDKTANPIAGHANGADIRPYNIFLLPLISY